MASDWAQRGIERRDVRNQRDEIRPPAKSKNTKKWCRGVEGREHENAWVVDNYFSSKVHRLKCVKCGKVFKQNFMSRRWGY